MKHASCAVQGPTYSSAVLVESALECAADGQAVQAACWPSSLSGLPLLLLNLFSCGGLGGFLKDARQK